MNRQDRPRITIVTLSFNQGAFLAQAIESVLRQGYDDLEYIVVDPGSSDGSRHIVAGYADRLQGVVLEPDDGPAEGLNNGFRRATGELYGFLNADDVLLPGALASVAAAARSSEADVYSGHALIIDAAGRARRRAFSDRFSLRAVANGGCVLMQPSTFFKASCFRAVGGFDTRNTVDWDAELWVDMALGGAKFDLVPRFLSGYRMHAGTLTTSADAMQRHREHQLRTFRRVMGRSPRPLNGLTRLYYRMRRYALCPPALLERVVRGPLLGPYGS